MRFLVPTLLLACTMQTTLAAPAAQPADLFDFWLGDWQVSWRNADGTTGKARNHVARILDGNVIEERFEEDAGDPAPLLKGRSLSVRDAAGLWRQAWADNQGGFFALSASVDGDKRLFSTALTAAGAEVKGQRMVFHDITPDAFTWDWEGTTDGGRTWKLLWRLAYRR
ncbi:MAG TPA: hypothetical protein VES00_08875 [Burkholderiaceae bacterium]|jgi:hypothetical protein|nr:hypothetical protein [Burkholderiaceae bacterium]